MERLMYDLMARARGLEPKHPHHYTTYHHTADSFIADETRLGSSTLVTECPTPSTSYTRLESSIVSECSTSCATSRSTLGSTPSTPDTSYSSYSTDSETDTSSTYTPLHDSLWSASQPTYIRGDYYDISPPSSPTVQNTSITPPPTAPFSSSFSIDAILGSTHDVDNPCNTVDTPAVVTSSISTLQLHDWDFFQKHRHTSSPVSPNTSHPVSSPTSHPAMYWCHACNTSCSSSSDATEHQSRHALNREPCNLKRSFSSRYGYVTSHGQTNYNNRVKCGLCDRIVNKCFFSKHVRCHETFTCRVCGIECATQTRLEDHMNIHAGNQPHTCKTCGSRFSDRRKLLNHSRQHKESLVPCRYCQKTFKTRHNRDVHERLHTGYRPYTCPAEGCNKGFPQKIQLVLHLRSHSA